MFLSAIETIPLLLLFLRSFQLSRLLDRSDRSLKLMLVMSACRKLGYVLARSILLSESEQRCASNFQMLVGLCVDVRI